MPLARQILLALSLGAVLLGAWLAPLDAPAKRQVDTDLKRALVSFATARALNAVISVAQGTELSVQPLGVGVTLAPGQLLDPVNDLVEKFSDLMLMASVALGVQKILISMGSYWVVSVLLSFAAIGWVVLQLRRQRAPPWLSGLLVVALMLRFAVPVVTLGTNLLWQQFLAADYATSQQAVDIATGQVASLTPAPPPAAEQPGWLDRMKGWVTPNGDLKARFERAKQAAEHAVEHIITLIVVFLLQTLIIPLALLWALAGLAKWVILRRL
jgi:hypothetical protein